MDQSSVRVLSFFKINTLRYQIISSTLWFLVRRRCLYIGYDGEAFQWISNFHLKELLTDQKSIVYFGQLAHFQVECLIIGQRLNNCICFGGNNIAKFIEYQILAKS